MTAELIAIWRYPVKSMTGEELNATVVTQHGLLGDRAYALVDVETGKVASAKNPRVWPDHDWLSQRDEVFEFPLPSGTFFDGSAVQIITTATLDRLRAISSESRFGVPRFRPNFVIEPASGSEGCVENDWIGRTLVIGDVALRVDGPCPRCIMTTLGQGSLPKDPEVLRTAVQHNDGKIGVYASIVRGGQVSLGDELQLS